MKEVKVAQDALLAKLRENLDKHVADFKEATEGYRKDAALAIAAKVGKLESIRKRLEAGEAFALTPIYWNDINKPVSHEGDYRQVIEMVAMSTDPVITLTNDEFKKYVMDNWEWKEAFNTSIAKYKG